MNLRPFHLAFPVDDLAAARAIVDKIGYPVLMRPSYVLGGRAMEIVYGESDLARYVRDGDHTGELRDVLMRVAAEALPHSGANR